jgi:hypothetical protein
MTYVRTTARWLACFAAHSVTMIGLDHGIRQLAYRGSDTPSAIAMAIWIASALTWSILAFWPPAPQNKLAAGALMAATMLIFLVVGFAFTIRF